MAKVNKTCENCGKAYECRSDRANGSRFCGWECQRKARKTGSMIPCAHCGKEVFRKPRDLKANKNSYCGQGCKVAAQEKELVRITCCVCGKDAFRYPSHIKQSESRGHNPHYCSVQCRGLLKRNRVIVNCANCSQSIERPASEIKHAHSFCSDTCLNTFRSSHLCGEKSPMWKGGWKSYYGPNWNAQSRSARKRDSYCCRVCGYEQKNHYRALDVHHLIPFREFGYIPDENDHYLKANSLTNLITACPTCHGKLDARAITFEN